MLFLMIILTPLMVFAGDISATAVGSTRDEAERNAYIELSKFINISVYDEETLKTSDSVDSSYSSTAVHTTANDFLKTQKSFSINGDEISCTVTLLESSAPSYIALLDDNIKTINSLEAMYEENKDSSSFEINKATIINILEEYNEYNNTKSVLLALDAFSKDIVKPNKTTSIWNNEYQNLIIQHNNDLLKMRNSLESSGFTQEEIENRKAAISDEIAQASLELKQIEIEKKNSINQLIEQRQAEIDNEIDSIMNDIIKNNAITSESLNSTIDVDVLLSNFSNYYNQYQDVNAQYKQLREDQIAQNEKDTDAGIEEIWNREYLFSEVDSNGRPTLVAKKLRQKEVDSYSESKSEELENNLAIISKKFVPLQNELQSNMLSILATLETQSQFTLNIDTDDMDCTLDVDRGVFVCTLNDNNNYLPIDKVTVEIPLASLDKKMDFNINDRNFDVNDSKQVAAYNAYTETVELYKKLMNEEEFLSYQFVLDIDTSTVANRFASGSKFNAKIVTEIESIKVVRNDIYDNVIDGVKTKYSVNARTSKTYEDFIDGSVVFNSQYYTPKALAYYNKVIGKTGSSSSSSSTTSSYSEKISNYNETGTNYNSSLSSISESNGVNALGDPYVYDSSTSYDSYEMFFSMGLGFTLVNNSKKAALSSYYKRNLTTVADTNFNGLSDISINAEVYDRENLSVYADVAYINRSFYQGIDSYSLDIFGLELGLNVPISSDYQYSASVIPYAGMNFYASTYETLVGAKLTAHRADGGFIALGAEMPLDEALANLPIIYLEFGW